MNEVAKFFGALWFMSLILLFCLWGLIGVHELTSTDWNDSPGWSKIKPIAVFFSYLSIILITIAGLCKCLSLFS